MKTISIPYYTSTLDLHVDIRISVLRDSPQARAASVI